MIIIGILLSAAGLGLLCWLTFALAVYALPLFVAVSAGMYASVAGAGILGSLVVGFIAGAGVPFLAQLALALLRSAWHRIAIALLFAAPAAIAGYSVTNGMMALTVESEGWQTAFSIIGAIAVAMTSWARIATLEQPRPPGRNLSRDLPGRHPRIADRRA